MFGYLGKFFTSVAVAITTLFGGHVSLPVEPANIIVENPVVIASTTKSTPSPVPSSLKTARNQIQAQSAVGSTQTSPQSGSGNVNLAIEKCKAENASWLAAWPVLEQAIRDKVRSDYQSTLWSYAQQYKGIITAGDIASSSSSSEMRQEQQAVSAAKTKFDLSGNEAYKKCLSKIQN